MNGVQGKTLGWIKSLLIGRTKFVVLDGVTSNVPVSSGVRQGSVMSSVLFLLYLNDLPNNTHLHFRLFADDTAVYLAVQGQEDSDALPNNLNELQSWERQHGICNSIHLSLKSCTYPGHVSP